MTKMIKYVVVSDEFGKEIDCASWEDIVLSQYMHTPGEDCDCEEDSCECGYFGDYIISLFEIPEDKVEGLEEYPSHPSHYLNEHGNELTLGDYI